MTAEKAFFDTNILVQTLDKADKHKQKKARQLLSDAARSNLGVVSTQVLQEFFVATTKKLGLDPLVVKELVHQLSHLETIVVTPHFISEAIDCSIINRLSFWDALIVVTAESARCSLLWSEDLNDGQIIRGVKITNPYHEERK
jgi:predicted nucleic acid-binding protein